MAQPARCRRRPRRNNSPLVAPAKAGAQKPQAIVAGLRSCPASLRAKRSNPKPRVTFWIASALLRLAMTAIKIARIAFHFDRATILKKRSGEAAMSSLSGKQGPRYRHAAADTGPYETLAVDKLTPIIGAEISGVDIGRLVSDDLRPNRQMDEIHRALAENLVIFFRDQPITPEQHLAFGRRFGELHIHPA